MPLKLIKLTKKYEKQLCEMIDEWRLDQEINHTNHSPWAIFKNDPRDFDFYLEALELKEAKDGKVPDSVFFLLDEERDRLLGAVNIRHYLNDRLLRDGGHIGDGVRPSERRKGYGTELVRLALIECKKLGIDSVLMFCDKNNVASAKTIVRNGGVLEEEFINEDGEIEQKYRIDLDGKQSEARPMRKMIAYCGLDCEKCDAYLATKNNDDALREKTAKLWSELNGITILPEQINCEGCRMDGVKTVFCDKLCGIRQCGLKKGFETCGDCPDMETCETLSMVTANNDEAKENLRRK